MSSGKAVAVAFALVIAACSSVSGESDDPSGSDTPEPPPLECETKGFPCSLDEVPVEILERSDSMSEDAVAMLESGSTVQAVEDWLADQDGVVEVDSDHDAIRFRLEGGRGTWVIPEGTFNTRGAFSAGAATGQVADLPSVPLRHIVDPDNEQKKALVLSPMWWEFGDSDDGSLVAGILNQTRGYLGNVQYKYNDQRDASGVTVDSFKHWDDDGFDVVHVVTHGFRLCKDGPCRAVIVAQLVHGDGPEGEGIVNRLDNFRRFRERGLELGKVADKVRPVNDSPLTIVFLTADFFTDQYGSGLEDTFIFFNACKTFGPEATDLADAIRGTSSVFLGWTENVDSDAAYATADALYESLSDRGYPAEVAYEKLGGLKSDTSSGAQLVFGGRSDGDDLRIRDVVELLEPASGLLLEPSSEIPIIGTTGDGVPDSVPYAVQVDGMTGTFAPLVTLHVSANGVEAEPQPITDGEVNDKDQWIVSGELPLGFDVEEDTPVDFRAWVELHSGGESDDETTAVVTGDEPIMGHVWSMEATKTIGFPENSVHQHTAVLTLEFEEGQSNSEPKPRYVVTGGTVTYDGRTRTALGCTYSGGGMTFEVTPEMIPLTRDGFDRNILTFDTTVTPVEYHGIIQIEGPDYVRTQNCPDDTAGDEDTWQINYGGATPFMSVVGGDHRTVESLTLIEERIPKGDSGMDEFTITRVK